MTGDGETNRNARAADFEAALRAAGVRITRPRRTILAVLAETADHPDAVGIFERASMLDPSISLSTVYRTMKLLHAHGAIERHAFAGGRSRFEGAGDHHDHLIDVDTGDVIEFQSDRIEELQRIVAEQLGFDLVHHRLELYGRRRQGDKQER